MENDGLGSIIDRGLARQPKPNGKYRIPQPERLKKINEERRQAALARWKERLDANENTNQLP